MNQQDRKRHPSSSGLFLCAVFLFGGKTAPYMPLGFVFVQNMPRLRRKAAVDMGQTFGHILVDGGFADAEYCGGLADGTARVSNIFAKADGARIYIAVHCFNSVYLPEITLFDIDICCCIGKNTFDTVCEECKKGWLRNTHWQGIIKHGL